MNERLVDYIRQYRKFYNREAIYEELLRAGFTQAQIDEAWVYVENLPEPPNENPFYAPPGSGSNYRGLPFHVPPRPRLRSNRRFWSILLGFMLGVPAVSFLVSLIFPAILGVLLIGVFAVAVIAAAILTTRDWVASRGLLYGVLMLYIVLPFIGLIIVAGICLSGGYGRG